MIIVACGEQLLFMLSILAYIIQYATSYQHMYEVVPPELEARAPTNLIIGHFPIQRPRNVRCAYPFSEGLSIHSS
ncbi:hypothetical protein F5Y11DRAFT_91942 [Daldinia sp. FL1419]|nr:hypothetical protein F5Y11DRAFT_91942 [Daldinia sp. FL1419]